MACEKYEVVKRSKDAVRAPAEVGQLFSDLAESLRQAEEVLVLPQLPTVQNIYAAERRVRERPAGMRGQGVHKTVREGPIFCHTYTTVAIIQC